MLKSNGYKSNGYGGPHVVLPLRRQNGILRASGLARLALSTNMDSGGRIWRAVGGMIKEDS